MAKTYANAKAALEAGQYAATINGQIERIEDSQVVIIHKTDDLGLTPNENDKISDAALALDAVVNRGSPKATISAGTSYTIQAGYYTGGTVSYEQGTDDYKLQAKTATPTKSLQTLGPDTGYYGLSSVTVNAIPEAYQDVTIVSPTIYATANDILTGKSVVGQDGNEIQGAMPNRGAASHTLDAHQTGGVYDHYQYTIQPGYHNGSGVVDIDIEEKNITPLETAQTIPASDGKVIGKVIVAAIDKPTYLTSWTSDATAAAANILETKTAYVNGEKITGTMRNNGAVSKTLTTDTDATVEYTVPIGYHSGTGKVQIVPEDKTVTATQIESHQAITVTATSGKVLRQVSIAALPANWIDTTSANPVAKDASGNSSDILASKEAYVNGVKVTGTIATVTSYSEDVSAAILASGASGATLDQFNEAFYKNGGEITMDGTLYTRLAAI